MTADVVCERPKNQYIAPTISTIITPVATPNSHFGVPGCCGTVYRGASGAGVWNSGEVACFGGRIEGGSSGGTKDAGGGAGGSGSCGPVAQSGRRMLRVPCWDGAPGCWNGAPAPGGVADAVTESLAVFAAQSGHSLYAGGTSRPHVGQIHVNIFRLYFYCKSSSSTVNPRALENHRGLVSLRKSAVDPPVRGRGETNETLRPDTWYISSTRKSFPALRPP